MNRQIAWGAVVLVGLSAPRAGAEDLRISLSTPAVGDGDTLSHTSGRLHLKGEVWGDVPADEVTVNGQPAALGARDLVVEGLEAESTPFQGVVVLQAGDTPVEVKARTSTGQSAVLRFTVRVAPEDLGGTAYALLVAVDDYQDPRITDLRYAEADAQAVAEALTNPQYGIVRPENLRVLRGAEATYRNVSMALEEQLVRRATRAEDVVFFYFAGHGAEGPHVSRGAAYYLVPYDADVANLLSTGIEKGRLQFLWGAVGAARKVFITDACHSGGMQDMRVLTASGLEAVEGFITLAAARPDQSSLELPRLGHGLFTYALTQGLQGAADGEGGNGDGFVSASELGGYLQVEVGKLAAQIGADQAPVVDVVPAAAQVVVATSGGQPLPAWTPSAPPPPLPPCGRVDVALRFGAREQRPTVVVAVQDEGGSAELADVAVTALMNRFLQASDAFRFVEPGTIAAVLEEQAGLAFSAAPGDLAAVARAVEADLILTGRARSEASGAGAAELLGTTVTSFQAYLSARVVCANSGEVMQAVNVQTPAMHLNAEMARRQALEKASASLADQLMGPLLERWAEMRRQRPNGQMTVSPVPDLEVLQRLETALEALRPAVREVRWRSSSDESAIYEFETSVTAQEAAQLLGDKGLPGFAVGKANVSGGRLSFAVKP
ncbi:MAG: caspase family protein [Candidatus Latescibacterota bacterium]